jgi:hypothetical protein
LIAWSFRVNEIETLREPPPFIIILTVVLAMVAYRALQIFLEANHYAQKATRELGILNQQLGLLEGDG